MIAVIEAIVVVTEMVEVAGGVHLVTEVPHQATSASNATVSVIGKYFSLSLTGAHFISFEVLSLAL